MNLHKPWASFVLCHFDGNVAVGGAGGALSFDPSPLTLKPGEGPPHIRLDRAAEFLFGDRL